ncbi:MAG: sensor histidine kinase [Balneolaceae bacterium]|nr:sensor histidine kinase [Balneolaceae bacterium]
MSLVALVPGIHMAWKMGFMGMLAADVLAVASILWVAFHPGISLIQRKLIFNAALYLVAVVLLYYLGSHGPGLLYQLTITIFVLLTLDRVYGYSALALNTLVCLILGVAIYFGFAGHALLQQYQLDSWIGVSSNLVFLSGTAVFLFPKLFEGLETAFTDQEQAESMLRESLSEKETLLMEIHHRVKNNMAIVSGMLELQAMDEEDPGLHQKLRGSIGRIKTMGTIHELLYRSNSFSRLEVNQNIRKLVNQITATVTSSLEIEVDCKLQPVVLNINQAIPLSLIINEVVTNAVKHAFKGRDWGMLHVSLQEKDSRVFLRIVDNGGGFPDNGESPVTDSLGIQLIQTLSAQLEGDYTYRNVEEGVRFTLEFTRQDVKGTGNAHLR